MSRIVGKPSPARERNRRLVQIAHALRYASEGNPSPEEEADLAAYLSILLKEIGTSIELSASAWEKRGYWVKADRFRSEWEWARSADQAISKALSEDPARLLPSGILDQVRQKTSRLAIPVRVRASRPWVDAARAGAAITPTSPPS